MYSVMWTILILLILVLTIVSMIFATKLESTNFDDLEEIWTCERNATRCKLEVVVNYGGTSGLEFAVHFDCSAKPIFNQHSRKVFRNVKRYKLEGDEVSRDGLALEYLHFPEQVELLEIADYCLEAIEDGVFGEFGGLEVLTLKDSAIRKIQRGSFKGLKSLKVLKMDYVQVESMSEETLSDLKKLEKILIINSGLIALRANALDNLKNITLVDSTVDDINEMFSTLSDSVEFLQAVNISSDQDAILKLSRNYSRLKALHIEESNLEMFMMGNYNQIETLNLTSNTLTESSVRIFSLPNLRTLDLTLNHLDKFTNLTVLDCPRLTKLNLSQNRLQYFHLSHFELLQEVILSGNQLHDLIPEVFTPTKNLIVNDNPWNCVWLLQLIQDHPQNFVQLRYRQVHAVMPSVRGLPCMVHLMISTTSTEVIPLTSTISTILHHQIQTYPTVTIVEPLNAPSKAKIILVTIVTGLFISHSILLMYNRYRRRHHVPFYRRLLKEGSTLEVGPRITITTSTDSFLYETPVLQETALCHIYEELLEGRQEEFYDHLQFHRLEVEEDVVDV